MQGTLTVGLTQTTPSGTLSTGTLQATVAAPVGENLPVVLAAGDNVIAVPPGATAVVIAMPAGNVVAVKLKQAIADVGVPLAPAGFLTWQLGPGATGFILNAAGALGAAVQIMFA